LKGITNSLFLKAGNMHRKDKAESEEDEDLWGAILKGAMVKDQLQKSNLIIVGDTGNGKRTLVKSLQDIG